MNTAHLTRMTDEDRTNAAIKREAAKAWAEQNLLQELADENYWRTTASDYGVRMPLRHAPPEGKYLKRAAKKLGVDIQDFVKSTGFITLKQFTTANSKWPAYALVGLLLEYHHENKTNPQTYTSEID